MDVTTSVKYLLKSISNIHRQGDKKNIFLFSTPRSGSTWLMEILATNPGMKYYDEPFNIRRHNVRKAGRFLDWEVLMPEHYDSDAIIAYLEDLSANNLGFMNPPPFRKNHWFITTRTVFKIHELEHMINDIKDQCNGQVVFLLRHPIATTISRVVFPRLENFVNSRYYRERFLNEGQLSEIRRLVRNGTKLQRGLVSWCYQNLVPLKHLDTSDWLIVTYEEAVLNPIQCCKLFMECLGLEDLQAMLRSVDEPASNIALSNPETLRIMGESDNMLKKRKLVEKWRLNVAEEEEKQAFEILDLFDLQAYERGRTVASHNLLHFESTLALAGVECQVRSPVEKKHNERRGENEPSKSLYDTQKS